MNVSAPWQSILRQFVRRLFAAGFAVRTTFDLQMARLSLRDNEEVPCPHHGSGRCTCQYIVLQISRNIDSPSAVVLHGYDSLTKVALLSSAEGMFDEAVTAELHEAIAQVLRRTHRNHPVLHGAAGNLHGKAGEL